MQEDNNTNDKPAQSIQLFSNPDFGILRTVEREGWPWFIAADACKGLDHSNVSMAISRLDEDEKAKLNLGLSGGDTNIISFPGLLSLILGSRKPEAREYKRWVTHEVLPSIHQHGGYLAGQDQMEPEEFLSRALLFADSKIKDLATKNQLQEKTISKQTAKIDHMRPKALFADAVSASDSTILIGDLAKIIKQSCGVDTGQKRLFAWLRDNGWLMKDGSSKNMPTQRSMDMKLFRVKETTISNPDGSVRITKTTKVTGRGQQYFVNQFAKMSKEVA